VSPATGLDSDTRCFGLRRVNPFLGVVAVVKTPGARALSLDGVHWQIQVLAHPPRGLWARGGEQEEPRYFRFGDWSESTGMTRVPLNPILDAGLMVARCQRIIWQVRAATPSLPFPLGPELELWLLDGDGLPLALLATALPRSDLDAYAVVDWTAGDRGDGRPFVSPTLAARGVPDRDASGRSLHLEALECLVAQRAAPGHGTQWFQIEGEEVLGLDHGADPALGGRRLARAQFPALSLRTQWEGGDTQRLVDEYLAWLAPYLLMLPDLPDPVRQDLETMAAHHALLVDALWRLYPRVLDPALIRRARIEARLRSAAA